MVIRQIPSGSLRRLMGFFCQSVKSPTRSTFVAPGALNENVWLIALVFVIVVCFAITAPSVFGLGSRCAVRDGAMAALWARREGWKEQAQRTRTPTPDRCGRRSAPSGVPFPARAARRGVGRRETRRKPFSAGG